MIWVKFGAIDSYLIKLGRIEQQNLQSPSMKVRKIRIFWGRKNELDISPKVKTFWSGNISSAVKYATHRQGRRAETPNLNHFCYHSSSL